MTQDNRDRTLARFRENERGNTFFFILLGVVLFAALAFVISRGVRTQTTRTLSARQAEIAASEMMAYAQRISSSVDSVLRKGVSENNLSFENAVIAGMTNADCTEDKCKIFQRDGGDMSYQPPVVDWLDDSFAASPTYGQIAFVSETCTESAGCDTDGDDNEDLVLFISYIKKDLCLKINEELGITNPSDDAPVDAACAGAGTAVAGQYHGSFGEDHALYGSGGEFTGKTAGCFRHTGGSCANTGNSYHFFSVLIERQD